MPLVVLWLFDIDLSLRDPLGVIWILSFGFTAIILLTTINPPEYVETE